MQKVVGSGTFRMNVALAELPDFRALSGSHAQPHHASGIIVGPSLRYMEQAYFDARTEGWSRAPVVEMLVPSAVDDSLAPPGRHVASLFCQHVHPRVEAIHPGRTWDDFRERVADLMIDTVDRVAPNFKRAVIARRALTPSSTARCRSISSSSRAPCSATRITECRSAASTCADQARIPAAASPDCQGATRRARFCAICVGTVRSHKVGTGRLKADLGPALHQKFFEASL